MTIKLSDQEIKELKGRFNNIVVNENVEHEVIVHTLSNGKIVKGVVTENGILQIKSVSNFLCG